MNHVSSVSGSSGNDIILLATRITAGLVIPFLLLAFIILYFLPGETGRYFAWQINPPFMSMFIGAGYLGGAYFFFQVVSGKMWHKVAHGFPPVTAFTWVMLIATILHWDRFSHANLGFRLWLILYLITPILVPLLWLLNRKVDSRIPKSDDIYVPLPLRRLTAFVGAIFLVYTLRFFFWPGLAISIWIWKLTPLTTRILSGWLAIMGVGSLTVAWDQRWSAWKVGVESIILWQVLVLVAAIINLNDFNNPFNWYLVATTLGLIGFIVIYVVMEYKRRKLAIDA
jgi:hypothetical protein